jgi:hypothetical protein
MDGDGRRLLREPATGSLNITLRKGVPYTISHWIGSGEQHRIEWSAGRAVNPNVFLPDDTQFLTAQPLPNSDKQDSESLRFVTERYSSSSTADRDELNEVMYLSARLRYGADDERPRKDISRSLRSVHIGSLNDEGEYEVRPPHLVGPTIQGEPNALMRFSLDSSRVGDTVLAVAPPFVSSDWVFRKIPVIERQFPQVFMSAFVGSSEADDLLDWRHARYSLYLSRNAHEPPSLSEKESRYEQALIERLGRPGLVSDTVLEFVKGRESGNVLAQTAGWLLCARSPHGSIANRRLSSDFEKWNALGKSPLAIADLHALQFFFNRADYQYVNFSAPVFSETWRLLGAVPRKKWLNTKLSIDPLSWFVANSGNNGELWSSWKPGPPTGLDSGELPLNGMIEKGSEANIRLVQRIQEAVQQSNLDADYFSELVSWRERTLLERRILDQILVRGAAVPEDEVRSAELLDEFARILGMPLPIVAAVVDKLAGQEWHSETTPPAPSILPTRAELPYETPRVKQHEVYARQQLTSSSLAVSTGFRLFDETKPTAQRASFLTPVALSPTRLDI